MIKPPEFVTIESTPPANPNDCSRIIQCELKKYLCIKEEKDEKIIKKKDMYNWYRNFSRAF
jgi:hypothetical protein